MILSDHSNAIKNCGRKLRFINIIIKSLKIHISYIVIVNLIQM